MLYKYGKDFYSNVEAIESITSDLTSWAKIKKNKWYLHALAFPIGIGVYFLFKGTFGGIPYFLQWALLAIPGWVLIWIFEITQGWITKKRHDEIETTSVSFERLKDVIFTTFVYWIGLVSAIIYSVL